MQIQVSKEIAGLMEKSAAFSIRKGHYYVGVEHLFVVLIENADLLPMSIQKKYMDAFYSIHREVERMSWTGTVPQARNEVFYTPRLINIMHQANKLSGRYGAGNGEAGHLLLAILGDAYAAPSRAMDTLRLGRGALLEDLRDALALGGRKNKEPQSPEVSKTQPASRGALQKPKTKEAEPREQERGEKEKPREEENVSPVSALTRDLTQAAREGKLTSAVGRDSEIFEILQVLSRKSKNNCVLAGESGVGKTKIVEALAANLVQDKHQFLLPNARILELNIAAMISGTQYRGALEERLLALIEYLKKNPDTILFIDEFHLIMGAGSTEGDSMDLGNLLKPALARGEIRCIGATTLSEYRKFVSRDPAIERRMQMIRIDEMSEEDTAKVLRKLSPSLSAHHGVIINERAIASAISLTQRYMPQRTLPDKAIDVLDQACARYRLKKLLLKHDPGAMPNSEPPNKDNQVTPHDIRKVVSRLTAIPLEEMTAQERLQLNDLERNLRAALIGQDEAISAVCGAVKKSRAGLADPKRPDAVLLFMGQTGVGKTHLAKQLAEQLFGSSAHLITFDMSEYVEEHSVARLLGAPPGYAGFDEESPLFRAVRNTPYSILLFDEIDKANSRVMDIFLPIFEEGCLKDSRGLEVSFRNCIIILTSNIGADILKRGDADFSRQSLLQELRQTFRPEFINRIDEIVPFYPLLKEDILSIVGLELKVIADRLKEQGILLEVLQQAREHLAEIGYNEAFGARELRRTLDKLLTTPISARIVDGTYKAGDTIQARMVGDRMALDIARSVSVETLNPEVAL